VPAAPLLSAEEIEAGLRELPGWQLSEGRLVKQFRCADFTSALAFVQRVAEPAEEQNHHPDVLIQWRDVTLSLWTHAAGGITQRDLRLARAIEALEQAR
jgi:4a-hydroxytetrahydrobiopterin dehydratase